MAAVLGRSTGSRGLRPTVRSIKPPGQADNPAGLSPVALQVLGRMANGLHCLGLTARPGTTTDTPRLPLGAPSGRGTLFGGGGSRSRATQVKPHPPTQSGGTASPGSSQATGDGAPRSRGEPQLPSLDYTGLLRGIGQTRLQGAAGTQGLLCAPRARHHQSQHVPPRSNSTNTAAATGAPLADIIGTGHTTLKHGVERRSRRRQCDPVRHAPMTGKPTET